MSEELRKQFELQPSYHKEDYKPFCNGWKACAKIKNAEIEELQKQNARLMEFIKNAQVSSGVCCCGDSMENHGYNNGHSPVDVWDNAVGHLVESNPSSWFDDQIGNAKKEQIEKCISACDAVANHYMDRGDHTAREESFLLAAVSDCKNAICNPK